MQTCETRTGMRSIPAATVFRSAEKGSLKMEVSGKEPLKKERSMRLKNLAEAIILQSIEDLWSPTHRQKSMEFFAGDGFNHCADIAGMKIIDRLKLIRMLRRLAPQAFTSKHSKDIRQHISA
jgi:hypothetical protein